MTFLIKFYADSFVPDQPAHSHCQLGISTALNHDHISRSLYLEGRLRSAIVTLSEQQVATSGASERGRRAFRINMTLSTRIRGFQLRLFGLSTKIFVVDFAVVFLSYIYRPLKYAQVSLSIHDNYNYEKTIQLTLAISNLLSRITAYLEVKMVPAKA